MRDLVYYVAATLDGFIAREDGSFDDFPWDDDFVQALLARYPETFPAPFHPPPLDQADNQRFDTVLMGRKTYEVGLRQELTSPYPTLDQFVFSSTLKKSPDPAVTVVSADPAGFVADLKRRDGDTIWICGGCQLATSLLTAGLVDEVEIKLNPILFGSGIPLVSGDLSPTRLELTGHEAFPSGHMLLQYRVAAGLPMPRT